MKKWLILSLIGLNLSGCSLFHIHKVDVDQGNIFTQENINQLHPGMTKAQVKAVMGNPVLTNVFTENRIEYVYTFQPGNGQRTEKRVSLIFQNGLLKEINQSGN